MDYDTRTTCIILKSTSIKDSRDYSVFVIARGFSNLPCAFHVNVIFVNFVILVDGYFIHHKNLLNFKIVFFELRLNFNRKMKIQMN